MYDIIINFFEIQGIVLNNYSYVVYKMDDIKRDIKNIVGNTIGEKGLKKIEYKIKMGLLGSFYDDINSFDMDSDYFAAERKLDDETRKAFKNIATYLENKEYIIMLSSNDD